MGFAPRSFDFTSILGIKTGFGGSANTQTKAAIKLKEDLLSGLQYGIIVKATSTIAEIDYGKSEGGLLTLALPLSHRTSYGDAGILGTSLCTGQA